MLAPFKRILAPPDFGDQEKNRLATVINVIVLTLLVAIILSWFSVLFSGAPQANTYLLLGISMAGTLVVYGLLRRRRVTLAGLLLSLLISGLATSAIFGGSSGIRTHLLVIYLATSAMAGFVLGRRGLIGLMALNFICIIGLFYAEVQGLITLAPLAPIGISNLITVLIVMALPSVTYYLLFSQYDRSLTTTRQNAEALAETNRQLQAIRASLEEQVAERTGGLATVTLISERLSAILDLDQLLAEVVNQVRDRFNYYHAHIYLLDERRRNLVVAEGTGAAGAALKEQQHSIPLDAPTSLVARAARSHQVVNVENVRQAPDWLPNDLLPDTYSEIAVPVVLDDQVVGVLDVQDDQVAAFDEADETVLRSLANQVAIAIRNAGLFANVEQTLADARAAQRRYQEEAWQSVRVAELAGRHLAKSPTISLTDEAVQRQIEASKQIALSQQSSALLPVEDAEDGQPLLVAPIKLQDLTVGTLHMQPPPGGQLPQEDELEAIEAIMARFGIMAETIRLTDVNRRRASREQTIRQVTEKMRSADSLEELVETTARELGNLFSGDYTMLELEIDTKSASPEAMQNGHS